MKKTINGVEYELIITESDKNYCKGCAAFYDYDLCNSLPDHCTIEHDKIWKEVKDDSAKDV